MRRTLAAALLLAAPLTPTLADDQAGVSREGEHYLVSVRMPVQAPVERVARVLTDYANLGRLHESIRESRILQRDGPRAKVHILTHTCVLVFCLDLVQVLDYEITGSASVAASMDGPASDFSYGEMSWRLEAESPERTLMRFQGDLVPKFWVPPLIGPWILQAKLLDMSRDATKAIAQAAADMAQPTSPAHADGP